MISNYLKNSNYIFLSVVFVMGVLGGVSIEAVDRDSIPTDVTDFYLVRHGQTDHNIGLIKEVHRNLPLNAMGQKQVAYLRRFIETLPIKTVCSSPLLRARETESVINSRLGLPSFVISDLREGSHQDWCEIQSVKNNKNIEVSKSLQKFMQRLRKGLKKALRYPGPVLIVAHGGVYSAICRLLDIDADVWAIANCTVVRFYKNNDDFWSVQYLFDVGTGSVYDKPYLSVIGHCQAL